MKVLITGGDSQLGRELRRTVPKAVEVIALDVDPLDITDREVVDRHLSEIEPEVVINTAAYTAVDRAEEDEELAYQVNAEGAENLAVGCHKVGARMVQISTDFVFSGDQSTPYATDAEPHPQSVYAASKLDGEKRVQAALGDRGTIVRTSWLYSRFGKNFALTMLQLFAERDELRVVDDQIGTPTWAHHLAHALWEISQKPELSGTLHWSDLGVASWFDFAGAILDESTALGLLDRPVHLAPIPSSAYPTPAKRPSFSVLDKHSTLARLETKPLPWRHAVKAMLQELL